MHAAKSVRAKPRTNNFFSRLRRNEDGNTAIEMAMVIVPFLAFVIALVEIALVYGSTVSLEHAVEKVARTIRVGSAVTNIDDFRNAVCDEVVILSNCQTKLIIDVRSFDSFSDLSGADVLSEASETGGDLKEQDDFTASFDTGEGESIILVSAYYKRKLIMSLPASMGLGLGNQSDGSRVISAVAAFRNEPFD